MGTNSGHHARIFGYILSLNMSQAPAVSGIFTNVILVFRYAASIADAFSPFEQLSHVSPPLGQFRVFGSPGNFRRESDRKLKLNDYNLIDVFVEFSASPNLDLMYSAAHNRVYAYCTGALDKGMDSIAQSYAQKDKKTRKQHHSAEYFRRSFRSRNS